MIFGTTAFAQAPFSALAESKVVYAGVTGFSLTVAQTRVIVETPFNINVTASVTGVPLQVALGDLGYTWLEIDTGNGSIWTPIVT
jgi:hypothetical protein